MLDVSPLQQVGTDTVVGIGGSTFSHGEQYHVYVVAVDESGSCGITSAVFTIDNTPPDVGRVQVGDGSHREMVQ